MNQKEWKQSPIEAHKASEEGGADVTVSHRRTQKLTSLRKKSRLAYFARALLASGLVKVYQAAGEGMKRSRNFGSSRMTSTTSSTT